MAFGWDDLILGGMGLFGNLFGAHEQSNAAKDAAQIQSDAALKIAGLQDKATQAALQFTRDQAENAFLNSEAARSGNYGQWAAGQRRLGTLGEMMGLGPREIPAYVPGVDPRFAGGASSGSSGSSGSGTLQDLQGWLASGMDPKAAVQKFNQQYGRTTGNEAVYYDPSAHGGIATIGLPNGYLAQDQPNGGWGITLRGGAPVSSAAPVATSAYSVPNIGDFLNGLAKPTPITPALPTPYTVRPIGAYL